MLESERYHFLSRRPPLLPDGCIALPGFWSGDLRRADYGLTQADWQNAGGLAICGNLLMANIFREF